MHRKRQRVADAQHRAERAGARPQVRNLAQEFERMPLGLQRVFFGIGGAVYFNVFGLQFGFLPGSLRLD